ncbi:MAG: uroporphyrinogen decarboxylase family protein, partial [Atribacterota bacterium]
KTTGYQDLYSFFGAEQNIEYIEFYPTRLPLERFIPFHPHSFKPGTYTLNEWGTAFVEGSNPAFDHFVAPMIRATSVGDFASYPFPDLREEYRHHDLEKRVQAIHEKELAAVAFLEMTIFEVAWQIRGWEGLLLDFFDQEDIPTFLLDRITELRCFQVKRFAEAGVDVIRLGDDVGTQTKLMPSPALYQKWLKPRLARVISSARSIKPDILISYHSDGYVEPLISDFIEAGIDVLNPVQPECMDPARLKRIYGDRLAFWGTIGIQKTLPFGTPDDVRQEVKTRIETVGFNGGLVLSPTHLIEPEVPLENLIALVEAAKKYGGLVKE